MNFKEKSQTFALLAAAAVAAGAYAWYRRFSRKPIVAVDLDEVLGKFVPRLIEWHNRVYKKPFLKLEMFKTYRFVDTWGGTNEESDRKVQEFQQSEEFLKMPTIPDAFSTLNELKDEFDFYVVTSRQANLEKVTEEWVNRHFPGIFEGVLLGNHWGPTASKATSISKPEMCRRIGACAIIDDACKYVTQCSESLPLVIQLNWRGENPWCLQQPIPKTVKIAYQWDHVKEYLVKNKAALKEFSRR